MASPKSEILAIKLIGSVGDQHVFGLDVAMHKAQLVGLLKPFQGLAGQAAGLPDGISAGLFLARASRFVPATYSMANQN